MNTKKIISSITVGAGAVILGLGLQYALAQTSGSWTPAPSSPPSNNVAAPVNVGSNAQSKTGSLALGTASTPTSGSVLDAEGISWLKGLIIPNTFQFLDGHANPTNLNGDVLTSDANGNAHWSAASGNGFTTPILSGTIGGGCYAGATSDSLNAGASGWGNVASCRLSPNTQGGFVMTCPSGYHSQVTSSSFDVTVGKGSFVGSGLCLAN